ncbi:Homeobox domain-containing protein [Heracleum sosnowskyi]|uniref:Protein WUSCHEL n=1 Tax=Heracleum sosnowskyi TaxID=360622 RepID=A0AAD8IBM3_9APIA|nr:Homeobox domain-containing protein [Heracleum sosnowskyi]
MAASNRHWPSMFKSKPHLHQWQQHEHHRTLLSSGGEERSNEPKPRWNPKPEQIRILEAIFNSGMVNPPRDEIRRIRVQLQEYGQVGDANVFYWFQNRKSRSKHKQQRNTKSNSHTHTPTTTTTLTSALTTMVPPSSSSSSSDKSSQKSSTNNNIAPFSLNITDGSLNSPTPSVNQPFSNFHSTHGEFVQEPFYFPVLSGGDHAGAFTRGFSFPEISISSNAVHQQSHDQVSDEHTARSYSNLLLTDLMMNVGAMNYKKVEDEKNKALQQQEVISYTTTSATMSANFTSLPPNALPSSTVNHVQGKSTVIINDVGFEVPSGPLNVKEVFGEDAVLVHSSGQPVVTNEWGVTLQPLQHGAFYYLI